MSAVYCVSCPKYITQTPGSKSWFIIRFNDSIFGDSVKLCSISFVFRLNAIRLLFSQIILVISIVLFLLCLFGLRGGYHFNLSLFCNQSHIFRSFVCLLSLWHFCLVFNCGSRLPASIFFCLFQSYLYFLICLYDIFYFAF